MTIRSVLSSKAAVVLAPCVVALAGLLAAAPAAAQPIEDAVLLALRSHPTILAAEQLQRAAAEGVNIARAGFLPTVDFRYANGWARTNNSGTRARTSRTGSDPQADVLFRFESSITISQLLFDGYATAARAGAAVARLGGAEFSVFGAEEAIALRAASAYLDVVRNRALVALANQYVAAHQLVVDGIRMQVEAGGGAEADPEQAEGRLAIATSTQTQFQGTLRNAEAAYREAIGDWPDEGMAAPALAVDALPATGEDMIAETVMSHSGILAAQQNVSAIEEDLRATAGSFYPRLAFDVAGSRNENAGGAENLTSDWTAMFSLTYNFYRGGADRATQNATRALLNEAKLRLEETRRLIEQSAWVAFNGYMMATAQGPQLEDAAAAAVQARADYADQFELGDRTLLDRLAVEDQGFAAETALEWRDRRTLGPLSSSCISRARAGCVLTGSG